MKFKYLLFVVCFALPYLAHSLEKPNTKNNTEELITIAKRIDEAIYNTTHSITVLSRDELELANHVHIQETLLRVPGVNLQRGSGQEYLPAIRSPVLTGAGACGSFLISQDNIPLRAAGFCNVNELFDAHTEQASGIEVIRGTGTAFYGSNALHGVININSYGKNTNSKNLIAIETGSDDFNRLKIAASSPSNNFGSAITLTTDGGHRENADYDQQKATFYHRTTANNWDIYSNLNLSNLNQNTAGFITGFNAFKDRNLSRLAVSQGFRDTQSARFSTNFSKHSDDSHWSITPYVRYTDMAFLLHFLPGSPLEENGQKSIGIQTGYYFQPRANIDIAFGLDGELTSAFLKQNQANPTQGSAFLIETIPTGVHYDYEVDANTFAAYSQLDWTLNEAWQLNTALRIERTHYDYDNKVLDGRTRDDGTTCGFGGCRYSRPADREDTFINVSPKLGVLYNAANNTQVYANILHGFRAPQATELYRLQREQQSADLEPVEIISLEIGTRAERQSLNYEIAAYAMKKNNVIFRDSSFFNIDGGKSEHLGLEFLMQYKINANWELDFNLNYGRHKYLSDQFSNGINIKGNDIDTAPRHFGNIRLSWLPSSDVLFELEYNYTTRYYLEPENQHQYSGHELFNMRVNWQLKDDWKISLRAKNLTDKRYADRADFTTFTQYRYFPGEPLSVFFSVEKSWN